MLRLYSEGGPHSTPTCLLLSHCRCQKKKKSARQPLHGVLGQEVLGLVIHGSRACVKNTIGSGAEIGILRPVKRIDGSGTFETSALYTVVHCISDGRSVMSYISMKWIGDGTSSWGRSVYTQRSKGSPRVPQGV